MNPGPVKNILVGIPSAREEFLSPDSRAELEEAARGSPDGPRWWGLSVTGYGERSWYGVCDVLTRVFDSSPG